MTRTDSIFARRRAFTLLELLLTIGIIALLLALVLVSLRGVRRAADRTASATALRSLVLGVTTYAADHNQELLPGAVPEATVNALRLIPRLDDWQPPQARDAESWVWRLAPWIDMQWESIYEDYRSPAFRSAVADALGENPPSYGPATPSANGIMASIMPSYGMNSTYCGGNDVHGDNPLRDMNPWNGDDPKCAATRLTEVLNPASFVVFAPSSRFDALQGVGDVRIGSPEIRPPSVRRTDGSNAVLAQWSLLPGGGISFDGDFDADDGVPYARWSDSEVLTARLDGSVETVNLADLALDLRLWRPDGKP